MNFHSSFFGFIDVPVNFLPVATTQFGLGIIQREYELSPSYFIVQWEIHNLYDDLLCLFDVRIIGLWKKVTLMFYGSDKNALPKALETRPLVG